MSAPNTVIDEVKKKIAQGIISIDLPGDAVHKELKRLKLNGVMTTNYDVLIEKVFDNAYKYTGHNTNKYLFQPTSVIGNMPFFHIHGLADCNRSLCLGYEHYMGMVEHLRLEINKKKNGISNDMQIKRILCGEDPANGSWGELFYSSNIAILGL